MNLKHILLDLDGTLWNTLEVSAAAYHDTLEEDGQISLSITTDTIRQEFGKTLTTIGKDLFPSLKAKKQQLLIEKCDVRNTSYLKSTSYPMLYPQVPETFSALSSSCQLYIVSNCQKGYIEMFLEKYQLASYITDMECFGNTGKGKAENIRLLMSRNGIGEAVYVGDTAGDYESATCAGVPFIFASYGYGTIHQSAHSIDCFAQLLDFLPSSITT